MTEDSELPSIIPSWWPRERGTSNPLRYLYRAMRKDGLDLRRADHAAMSITDPDSDVLRHHVARAVVLGSQYRSPFLHTSVSFHGAHRFKTLGNSRRGEEDTIMVRLDLVKLYLLEALSQYTLIDLSNDVARKDFFVKGMDGYGEFVRENFTQMIKFAEQSKEVLVKWRGEIPIDALEVLS